MKRGWIGRALGVSSLVLLLFTSGGAADDRDRFARETGLDRDLVNLVKVDVGGAELTMVFVYITDRTFNSRISSSLRDALLPYVGRNAFYVNPNVKEVVSSFPFVPSDLGVQTGGSIVHPRREDWVEITSGFLDGRFEVNPAGPSQGSGSEGILVLGESVDLRSGLEFTYGSERAVFQVLPSSRQEEDPADGMPRPRSLTQSHDPVTVNPIEDVESLEEVLALPEFSSAAFALLFELPSKDVRTMSIEPPDGSELRLLCFRLTEAIRTSALGGEWIGRVEPLIDTGAVMVWAYSPTGAVFSPWALRVVQDGVNYVFFSSASFVELTEGFTSNDRLAPEQLSAGIVRLPVAADPSRSFALYYGRAGVDFP